MTIPEDLKSAAYALVDKMKAEDPGFDYGPYEFAIAAAWAERQRCADVAKKVAEDAYGDTSAIGAAALIMRKIMTE